MQPVSSIESKTSQTRSMRGGANHQGVPPAPLQHTGSPKALRALQQFFEEDFPVVVELRPAFGSSVAKVPSAHGVADVG